MLRFICNLIKFFKKIVGIETPTWEETETTLAILRANGYRVDVYPVEDIGKQVIIEGPDGSRFINNYIE